MYNATKIMALTFVLGGAAGMTKAPPPAQLPAPEPPAKVQIEGVIDQVIGSAPAAQPSAIVVNGVKVCLTTRTALIGMTGTTRSAELKVGKKVVVIGSRYREGLIVAVTIYVY